VHRLARALHLLDVELAATVRSGRTVFTVDEVVDKLLDVHRELSVLREIDELERLM
jgi:hypothetical protein